MALKTKVLFVTPLNNSVQHDTVHKNASIKRVLKHLQNLTFQDPRIEGGYENVPTRDIHMNQIDYDDHWLYFLNTYVRPLQEKVFLGYFSDV
jgi:hypothetical protein